MEQVNVSFLSQITIRKPPSLKIESRLYRYRWVIMDANFLIVRCTKQTPLIRYTFNKYIVLLAINVISKGIGNLTLSKIHNFFEFA